MGMSLTDEQIRDWVGKGKGKKVDGKGLAGSLPPEILVHVGRQRQCTHLSPTDGAYRSSAFSRKLAISSRPCSSRGRGVSARSPCYGTNPPSPVQPSLSPSPAP